MTLAQFRGPVVQVDADTTVLAVARQMRDRRVGSVVVTRERRPIGIVTDRDLVLRALAENVDPGSTPISRCVTFDPVTVSERDGVATAAARMRSAGVRRIPIVNDEGELSGIVTADDLLGQLGRELAELCEAIDNASDATDSR